MLLGIAAIQVLMLVLLVALFLRRPVLPAAPMLDERLTGLPDAVVKLGARMEAQDAALHGGMEALRREQAERAAQSHGSANESSRALREEVTGSIAALGRTLHEGLNGFRTDNGTAAKHLHERIDRELSAFAERFTVFVTEAGRQGTESREALHTRLTELGSKNVQSHELLREALGNRLGQLGEEQRTHQENLRTGVEEQLKRLNADNAEKLEKMRETVDEKLQKTLHTRLTESFGQVTTHLGEVQKGLGEMKELATGVSDLKKVFSNVKARGIVGEFQLGMQLEQMFAREQYEVNTPIKPGSAERVEFALKIPQGQGTALFPIDSKFPREDWERLEHAYDHGGAEDIAKAGAAFERAIRAEGKRICEKYIYEPVTLPHAILFLPTEGLYAEVMRRPGLQSDLQQNCNVTIAGPSTLMAILTSFRMGFHSLALERKGNEVWKVLGGVKTEFGKFETLMTKVEKQVGTVQNTLGEIAGKTKTINRSLRGVTELSLGESRDNVLSFEDFTGVAPLLAAAGNVDE